jgi:hypothetical protein
MTFTPITPVLVVRNISKYDVNILGRVKLRPGEQKDLYAELEYNEFGSLTSTVLKELESPSGEIYRLWKVLNVIRVVEFVNSTHVGAGISADSFSTSNDYFEGAVLGFESGELKWLAGGGGGGITAVTASSPLSSSGGATPIISLGTVGVANGGTGTTTQFTQGSVVFAGPSGVYAQDSANLAWDDTNDRLGIGIAVPTASLHVAGTVLAKNAANSTTAFQVQNAAGAVILDVDTINSRVGIGAVPAAHPFEILNNFAVGAGGRIHTYAGSAPLNGQVLIGDTANGHFDKATLTAGTNIGITNAAGSITVGLSGTVAVGNGGTGITAPGSLGNVLTSDGTGWVSSSPAGGPPSGAAGGDLTGSTYPNPIISSFGGKIHWVVVGGKYATLQAAVNAAAADDTIMVGPPALGGTWADPLTGGTVFPAGKRLAVVGMTGRVAPLVDIGKVTFTVSSGLNINQNELYLRGLFINGSFVGSQGVLFSGANPARLRLQDCYVFNSGISGDCVVVANTGSSSSLYLDGCVVQTAATNTASVLVKHTAGYTLIKNGTELSGGGANAMTIAAGTVEVFNSLFETSALSTGIVTAVTNNTITDASKNYTVNSLVGQTVYIAAGTGAGQSRIITANTATQITVGVNWSPNPLAGGSTFSVGTPRPVILVTGTTGTTASITTTTIRSPIGDSTGISITGAGAVVGMNNSVLSVASGGATAGTGTGYAISGITGAIVVAGQMAYSNSAVVPFNVKFKSTLVSISTVTQSSTALANAGLTSAA